MKKLFILIALLTGLNLYGQNTNLIFFSEQGEKFYIVLNGIRQNAKAETNVKVTGLPAPNYKCKVIFEDPKLGELDKNLMFQQGTETTFNIKKNGKGEYVVRYLNEVPIAEAPPTPVNQQAVVYTTTSPAPASGSTTYSQTTTTTTNGVQGGGINMNITDPETGQNVSMNVNVNVPGNVGTTSSTTYTTTTTTSSSQTGDYQPADNHESHHNHNTYVLPGYNGPVGCPNPMSPTDFASVKQSISSKSFDDTKLTIAKQVISSNCLLSSQVKEIMMLFSFEDTCLELAKYSYGYTYDIGNYYKLNDAFKFESSIEELNTYVNSKK